MASIMDLLSQGLKDDGPSNLLMRDCLLELGTTMTFVWVGTLIAVSSGAVLSSAELAQDIARLMPIAFAFGMTITCLVYSTGHLSGGHMNPGVSLMMFLKRQIGLKRLLGYWICQLLGALVGAALTWGCVSGASDTIANGVEPPFLLGATTKAPALTTGNAFLMELLGSTFFFTVIGQTALDKRSIATTAFPPLVIGISLIVVHLILISGTGCGVNPARTFGPAMIVCMKSSDQCDLAVDGDWWWIYWIGPFLGSGIAAELTFWLTKAGEMEAEVEQAATAAPDDKDIKNESADEEVAPMVAGTDQAAAVPEAPTDPASP